MSFAALPAATEPQLTTPQDLKQNKFVIEAEPSETVRRPATCRNLSQPHANTRTRLAPSSPRSRQRKAGKFPSRSSSTLVSLQPHPARWHGSYSPVADTRQQARSCKMPTRSSRITLRRRASSSAWSLSQRPLHRQVEQRLPHLPQQQPRRL
jgi:hypothetical protein